MNKTALRQSTGISCLQLDSLSISHCTLPLSLSVFSDLPTYFTKLYVPASNEWLGRPFARLNGLRLVDVQTALSMWQQSVRRPGL